MSTRSFYRNGSSVTDRLSEVIDQPHRSSSIPHDPSYSASSGNGSMYEFPFDPYCSGMNQKLDRMVTLILEQKEVSKNIQKETNDLRREVATLMMEVSVVKEKVEKQVPNDSSTSSKQKKIPSQLSVSSYGTCSVVRQKKCMLLIII